MYLFRYSVELTGKYQGLMLHYKKLEEAQYAAEAINRNTSRRKIFVLEADGKRHCSKPMCPAILAKIDRSGYCVRHRESQGFTQGKRTLSD